MTDFHALDRETRTYALIGKFLFDWAYMEGIINDAIGKATDLSGINLWIVTSNIQLRDKLHILRTAVNESIGIPDDQKEYYSKTLVKLGEYSKWRNMIAHDAFFQDNDGDGVQFLVIKAKGKFTVPDERWSVERFHQEYNKINAFAAELNHLKDAITKNALVEALIGRNQHSVPSEWLFGLGHGGLLSPQLQDHQSLSDHLSSQEITAQTPEDQEEKDGD